MTMDRQGRGCAKVEDRELLIPGTVPGDRVLARVEALSRHHPRAFGRCLQIPAPSPDRRPSPCPRHERCGGCPLITLTPEAQQRAKLELLDRAMGDIVPSWQRPVRLLGSPFDLGYRRRAKYVVGRQDGRVRLGAYARGSHRFVATEVCPIVCASIRDTLPVLAREIDAHDVPADGRSALRFVQLRSNRSGQLLLTLVARANDPSHGQLAASLAHSIPGLIGVTLDINPAADNVLLSGRSRLLWGQETIPTLISGLEIAVDPYAFTQIHGDAGDRLSHRISDLVRFFGEPGVVVDLHSGIGAIGLAVAKPDRTVICIDRELRAVTAGADAARKAGLGVHFAVASDESVAVDLGNTAIKTLILDPPRRGLTPGFIARIPEQGPGCIVYVSCNPRALARDLVHLKKQGYGLSHIEAHDLFPQTAALETVAVLTRPFQRLGFS